MPSCIDGSKQVWTAKTSPMQHNQRSRETETPASGSADALRARFAGAEGEHELLRLMADHAHDWTYFQGLDGTFFYVSPSCERITGYTREEFLQDKDLLLRIVHPDDRPAVREHMTPAACALTELTPFEFRIVRKDGQERWIGHLCVLACDAGGQVIGWRGSNRDITLRKREEAALREAREHTQYILSHITDRRFAVDSQWRISEMNQAAEDYYGVPREAVLGQVLWDLCAHGGESEVASELRRAMRDRVPVHIESESKLVEGRSADIYVFPYRDGLVAYFRDITERKRAEHALAASERRMREILDALPVGVFIADATGRITDANRAARVIWGGQTPLVNRLEEYGAYQAWWPETCEPLRPEEWAVARAIRDGEDAGPEELDILCFDGKIKTILNYAKVIRDDGGFTGAVAVNVDITDRKAMEKDLRSAREDLERRVQDRTADLQQALDDLQDEVRQRLTAQEERRRVERELIETAERERRRLGRDLHDTIQGNLVGVHMILQTLAPKVQDLSPALGESMRRITDIVRQTIEQTRGLSRALNPVDLAGGGLITALQRLADTTTHVFGHHCEFVCPEPLDVEDAGAASQLYHIASEAVNNAVKHSGGTRILLRLERASDAAVLSVADDGVGLPEWASPEEGMGLRTMSYRASLMGGMLQVHSPPQGGTVVECRIPPHLATPREPREEDTGEKAA